MLTVALYYRFALGYSKSALDKTFRYVFIPQLLLLGGYFALFYGAYHVILPHENNLFSQSILSYLSKPPKYIFNVLLLGRFFPYPVKQYVYTLCDSVKLLVVFYAVVAMLFIYPAMRFSKASIPYKVMLLLLVWIALTTAILMPLPFPDAVLLVFYDRYAYFCSAFMYMLLALAISYIPYRIVPYSLFTAYGLVNLYCTIKLNLFWKHSAYVTSRLLHNLPATANKTILLLNIPENMNGVPMIGAQPEGEYKMLRKIITGDSIKNTIYDVASYNMLTAKDGAHVTVVNDSTVHVTLNQWGTWWWYGGHGAVSYETPDYKVNMVDLGRWYELTLKHTATNYLLLYEVGDQWRIVDMSNTGRDQY